jgi:hypothetical protein
MQNYNKKQYPSINSKNIFPSYLICNTVKWSMRFKMQILRSFGLQIRMNGAKLWLNLFFEALYPAYAKHAAHGDVSTSLQE